MFLETTGFVEGDLLIPINRIKAITKVNTREGWKIIIMTEDDSYTEMYRKEVSAVNARYEYIKAAVNGK